LFYSAEGRRRMLYTPNASSATTKRAAGHTTDAPCPVVGNSEPAGVGVGSLLAAGVGVGDGLGGKAVGVAAAAPDASVGDGPGAGVSLAVGDELAALACPLPTTSVTVA
jgi:hypothetical protein